MSDLDLAKGDEWIIRLKPVGEPRKVTVEDITETTVVFSYEGCIGTIRHLKSDVEFLECTHVQELAEDYYIRTMERMEWLRTNSSQML